MIAQLNTIAQLWWEWMGGMFWQVSLLIILVTAIDMAIRRWAWPQVRYVLWGLIFIKLIIPPTWQMPTSLISWIQPLIEKRVSIQIEPQEEITDVSLEMESDVSALIQVGNTDLSGKISFKSALLLGWIVGMAAFGFILIRKMFQLNRWYRRQDADREIPNWFRALLKETAMRLKLKKSPVVLFSKDTLSPAVYGLFRPVLLLPEGFFNRLSRDEAEHILIHELCHLKRGDLWVHWFCLVIQMVYWFNPLLIWTRRRMRYVCEICCDLSVADILREKTKYYRETLIRTARELFTETVEPGIGLLGVFEEPFRIVPRLQWLEKKTWENRKRKTTAAFITCLAMFAFVMPMAGLSQTETQNQDPSVQNDLQPVKWSADEVRWDNILKSVFISGNIYISFESITIEADNATIRTNENFEAGQQNPSKSFNKIEANGNVRVDFKDGTATSEKAVYDRETDKLVLSGGVELINDNDTISGHTVEIDFGTGKISVIAANAMLSAQPTDVVYEIVDTEEPPRPIRVFPPKYPLIAEQEKIAGRVMVELVVTKDGTPKDPWVIDAEPPDIFEEAALEAVRKYEFTPGIRNGEAVDVKVKLPISFVLDEPDEAFQLDPEAKDPSGIKYEMSAVDRPPRVLRVFPPLYPSIAKEEQIEGKVLLRLVIDVEGKAQEPEVVMAVPYGVFEESALEVVKLYQFEPALMNGMPVACIVHLPIVYSLGTENNQPASLPEEVSSFNFKNAGIKPFFNFISDMTGKRFVIDDDVKGNVTVLSQSIISIDELNKIYESVLYENGLEAVPSGESIRIKRKGL